MSRDGLPGETMLGGLRFPASGCEDHDELAFTDVVM